MSSFVIHAQAYRLSVNFSSNFSLLSAALVVPTYLSIFLNSGVLFYLAINFKHKWLFSVQRLILKTVIST